MSLSDRERGLKARRRQCPNPRSRTRTPRAAHSRPYVLTQSKWSERHGSDAIAHGRLKAETDYSDYLFFYCPGCYEQLKGGVGIGFEGWTHHGDGVPVAISLRLHCIFCGFRDFFKIQLDEKQRYGTAKARSPVNWARSGSAQGKRP